MVSSVEVASQACIKEEEMTTRRAVSRSESTLFKEFQKSLEAIESQWECHKVDYSCYNKELERIVSQISMDSLEIVSELKLKFFMDLTVDMESVNESFVLRKKALGHALNDLERLLRNSKDAANDIQEIKLSSAVENLHVVERGLKELKNYAKINSFSIEKLINKVADSLMQTPEEFTFRRSFTTQAFRQIDPLEDLKMQLVHISSELECFLGESSSEDESQALSQLASLNIAYKPRHDSAHRFADVDELSENPEKSKEVTKVLNRFKRELVERSELHFGYPYNLSYNHTKLNDFLGFSLNNLGDPFVESNYGVHSRRFEVSVLDFFADLWKIPVDEYWGYVTTCGTEGNLHGILVAREILPDGVLYASKESHYSVFKAARYYRMDAVPCETLPTGEIDYDDLEKNIQKNIDKPVIINANIGTTVKGAVDNLDKILEILKRNNITEDRFYIHCDGALFALMLPFLKEGVEVNFEKPIGSMSVSGHKFMGCPMPCGVIITRKENIRKVEQDIEYLNSKDTTIMGSRNGQAPLFLWHTIQMKGKQGFAKDVEKCMGNAKLLRKLLEEANISCMLNDNSNTVVFEKPEDMAFIRKWQLACEGNIAHAIVMPNVTSEKIMTFVKDLVESRKTRKSKNVCIKNHIGKDLCICVACSEYRGDNETRPFTPRGGRVTS